MALRVEHPLHERRRGRNLGVGLMLAGVIGIVFGLTVVKAMSIDDIRKMEAYDYVSRPALVTVGTEGTE